MKSYLSKFSFVLFCLIIIGATPVQAIMLLHFDSSEKSWVGQGESFTVTPDDGYDFTGRMIQYDKSLWFRVASEAYWDPFSNEEYHYWILNISVPYEQTLEVGYYDNAARFPFQDESQPGLTFSGDHRGNNKNSGFFEIFEILFDNDGDICKLAVDFTQFGEENPERWINGQLRFNSDVPLDASNGSTVPEPATITLFLTSLLPAFLIRRRYSNR